MTTHTTPPPLSIYQAVERFLGPLMAEYARLIDEGSPDMDVIMHIGGYRYATKLADLKALDRAFHAAFDAKLARSAKRSNGTLL